NWRGTHGSLVRALRKRFRSWGFLIYLAVLIAALAALVKPLLFWQLPEWWRILPEGRLLQASATVDTVAFLFEYLCGIYLQVDLALDHVGVHCLFRLDADLARAA